MPREMRVYLVRHGESEANLDKSLNARVADHMVPLSARGHEQAVEAGHKLRAHLEQTLLRPVHVTDAQGRPDRNAQRLLDLSTRPRIRLWQSPYLRTRQTAQGLLSALGDLVTDVRESDLIREQEFGYFDGVPDEELPTRFPVEHAHYKKHEDQKGRYFARMPGGESRCDVAQRVHQFFGTLHRDAERHGIDTVIVVNHGVTMRCFVKAWCGLPYEWIEEELNPGNCAIRLIEDGEDRSYVFEGFKGNHTKQEHREEGVVEVDPVSDLL